MFLQTPIAGTPASESSPIPPLNLETDKTEASDTEPSPGADEQVCSTLILEKRDLSPCEPHPISLFIHPFWSRSRSGSMSEAMDANSKPNPRLPTPAPVFSFDPSRASNFVEA